MFFIVLLFSQVSAYALDCFLPTDWDGVEYTEAENALRLTIVGDRNLYIHYYNQKQNYNVLLSHKIYSCDGKYLSVIEDRDENIVPFAIIENLGKGYMRFHMQDQNKNIKSDIIFRTL